RSKDIIDDDRLSRNRRMDALKEEPIGGIRIQGELKAEFGNRTQSLTVIAPGVAGGVAGGAAAPMGTPGAFGTGTGPNPAIGPAVHVRHDFRATAVWRPDVVTDRNGKAVVKLKLPESLTTWTATARAITAENQVGIATSDARTNEPMVVRLEGPRFFVAGDTATVSAVVNNNTDAPIHAAAMLGAEGLSVTAATTKGVALKPDDQAPIDIPAHGEARVDWSVRVDGPGAPRLKVTARNETYADAMERTFIAYEHGLDKFASRSGKVRGDGVAVTLDIPAARKRESTAVTIQISPSMAVTLLDSLPYLINYPYGCTEQTMSRFLPAAITTKTLKDLGLRPEDVAGRLFGGVEPATASQTHPGGAKDLKEMESMVDAGLSRLYAFQHDDGGWGWWKEDDSDHFMTAYVVWGLSLARDAGVIVDDDRLQKAAKYLDAELVKEESTYDRQAWMIHALAEYQNGQRSKPVTKFESKAFNNLWDNRTKLNAYTRALLALAAHNFGYVDKARILIDNLENGVAIDRAPDRSVIQIGPASAAASVIPTAHWGEDGIYYRWSDGGVEATAFALRAMLAIDPKNKLIEPVTNWLIKNRRGAQWNNTRDTAITVLSLDEYLSQSHELQPDSGYQLSVNGHSIAEKTLTAADALAAPALYAIPIEDIKDGANEVRITRKSGAGAIYFAASARYFSLEEPVTPSGNEVFARRDYYRLIPRQTLLKGDVYDRQPLRDGDTVTSGDRIETVITVESKNNYEYLMFEDLKPAGLEAVGVQSDTPLYASEIRSDAVNRKFGGGAEQPPPNSTRTHAVAGAGVETDNGAGGSGSDRESTGRTVFVHQELRDRKVALFMTKLPQGVWEIRYDMRAEVPGAFHALPVTGGAMYVPEIRCNGAEVRLRVEDKR
ncbi:MAG TPA: alpha-2-macroglobulin family protein, partial [Blastocatellia bacterium]|nr:alpha-2-macroglobulin family protein [Blastocatellia bacterium]